MVLGKARPNVVPDYGGHPDYIDFYSEFDLYDIGDGSAEFHVILRDLAQRAFDSDRKVILGIGQAGDPVLAVELLAGENSRHAFIGRHNCAAYQDFPFEDYEFLPRYDAILSTKFDWIEAKVAWARYGFFSYARPPGGRTLIDESSGAEIRFGWPSPAAQTLLGVTDPATDPRNAAMTLALVGAHVGSASEAVARLESIGNAFLFQVSLVDGDLASLVETSSRNESLESFMPDHLYQWNLELSFPRRKIQAEPLALYYYAGTLNDDFPLLQFLAYYQVLEYYFVTYSHLAVTESVRSMLLRPKFDSHDVGQVAQIVDHVLTSARRRGFGSESDQLRATITKCLDYRSLRAFLTEHDHRGVTLSDHIANPQRLAGVNQVDIGQDGDKVLRDLANRIYGIRNRIVHAKQGSADDAQEPLFPFSEESKALQPDIEVLRYVAASVLIESATGIA